MEQNMLPTLIIGCHLSQVELSDFMMHHGEAIVNITHQLIKQMVATDALT